MITVERRLDLDDDAVLPAGHVLGNCGNCSSATVLLVIGEVLQQRSPAPGEHMVAMAFGPRLTLYAGLLRVPVAGGGAARGAP